MDKFIVNEEIELVVETISFNEEENANVKLTFFDKDQTQLGIKEDKSKVKDNIVTYTFTVEDIAKEIGIDPIKVKYIDGWIDADEDGIVDYNEEERIEIVTRKGTLRMGIFFDGTGNDPYGSSDGFSNVKKLFDLYPNPIQPDGTSKITDSNIHPKVQSAYIRGVGSTSHSDKQDAGAIDEGDEDFIVGAALGAGATKRMEGMLFYIQNAVKEHKDEKKYLPEFLAFDIFGFSRGSAIARHFVNVLKQEGEFWDIGEEYKYSIDKTLIKTLNIFDTVGSIGIAGKDIDPGFTYHIDLSYIEDKVHHFVANDEYRFNFDGQLAGENDKDYPQDMNSGKTEEIVLLGAHSDIGGGYSSTLEHQVSNNQLAKYYLHMMYEKCKNIGLPLKSNPNTPDWSRHSELKKLIEYFDKKYQEYPNLKIAHKKLREWQARRRDKFTPYFNPIQMKFNYNHGRNRFSYTVDQISYSKDVLGILDNDKELFLDFIEKSNYFHDTYIHISHGTGIGMGSEKEGNRLHRDYFIPRKENMEELTNETQKLLTMPTYSPYGNSGLALSRMNQSFKKLKTIKFEEY